MCACCSWTSNANGHFLEWNVSTTANSCTVCHVAALIVFSYFTYAVTAMCKQQLCWKLKTFNISFFKYLGVLHILLVFSYMLYILYILCYVIYTYIHIYIYIYIYIYICMYIENFRIYAYTYIYMILYMIYMFEYMIQVLWPWNRNSLTLLHCFPPRLVELFYRFYKIILSSIFIVIIYIKFCFGKMYISTAENRLGSAITNCKTIFSSHDLSCSTAMPWLALQKNY